MVGRYAKSDANWMCQACLISVCVLVLVTLFGAAPPALRGEAMVAADHILASEAGATVLRKGGNAVEAAVAAALAAGVVQPAGSGLGGGLKKKADGKLRSTSSKEAK